MVKKVRAVAPDLWGLVFAMLSGGDAFDEDIDMDAEAGTEEMDAEEVAMWVAVEKPGAISSRCIARGKGRLRAARVCALGWLRMLELGCRCWKPC